MKTSIHLSLWTLMILTLAILCFNLMGPAISSAKREAPNFNDLLVELQKEALGSGISPKTVDVALTGLEPIQQVIEADRNQLESKLTLDDYLGRVVSEARINRGRQKLGEHRSLLSKIADNYGVQPRLLVALWGIETNFGRYAGSYPVIGSLVTLIYEGRRDSFFRKELMYALRILDEGHISLEQMRGSWAGAMGQFQFMPSTFDRYAVDFNGDGRRDIWSSLEDGFASAANYLFQCGWKAGQSWGTEVILPDGLDQTLREDRPRRELRQWQALGVRPLAGQSFGQLDMQTSLLQPDGPKGRAFLVSRNYEVMLKWNRSHNFALAVGLLSDQMSNP